MSKDAFGSPMKTRYRIGQIVPSSNTTMETEIPAMLRAREQAFPERFTFHSSRMRMKKVTKEELEAMDADSDRCALELSDARVDVMGYACLVAIMSMGHGYHRLSEARLHGRTLENGAPTPVVTSAGALVDGLNTLGAKRISVVAPYMKPLTQLVVDYIEHEGIQVHDYHALEISDNLAVGARDPLALVDIYKKVSTDGIDALVLSACVQMPSLEAVQIVEDELGIPVVSASVCTTYQMLKKLNLQPCVPNAGSLLSGRY
jgi:maleate isomerase